MKAIILFFLFLFFSAVMYSFDLRFDFICRDRFGEVVFRGSEDEFMMENQEDYPKEFSCELINNR